MSNKSMERKNLEEDENKISTLLQFAKSHLHKLYIDHLPVPSIKELPTKYIIYIGLICYLSMGAVFSYFAYTSYENAISQAYIALDPDSGTCYDVSISVTGDYMADSKGNWIGSPQFDYSIAKYAITLNNFQSSGSDQYEEMMIIFQKSLIEMGQEAVHDNLAKNLLRWISFVRYYSTDQPLSTNLTSLGYGQLQYIQMSGDPLQIFALNSYQIIIGSPSGFCPMSGYTTYDQANGYISTTLNYTTYMSIPSCAKCGDPKFLGYVPTVDNHVFPVSLEVRAISTALAVNLGILPITNLIRSGEDHFYFSYNNVSYAAGEYYDLRYYQMKPIFCVRNVTAAPSHTNFIPNLCFLTLGQTIALPTFNHLGASSEEPIYCDCKTNGRTHPCQEFNLMFGLIYYPITISKISNIKVVLLAQINFLLKLITKQGSYNGVNVAAFNASWTGSAKAFGIQQPEYRSQQWTATAFKFCQLSSTVFCSMMIYHAQDALSQYVSSYKYDLLNGSCADSFTVPNQVWKNVVLQAPTALSQDYYECYESEFSAFFDSVGIACGNTSLAVPVLSCVLLPLLYVLLLGLKLAPPKKEYNNQEKEQALDILSLLLLRLRDGKTRGVKKNGVLAHLTKELITAAKDEGGYPDSDDEEEEEDPSDTYRMKRKSKKNSVTTGNSGGGALHAAEEDADSDDEEGVGEDMNRPSVMTAHRKGRRRGSAYTGSGGGGAGGGGVTSKYMANRRHQMQVFTKHLQEEEEPTSGGGGGRWKMFRRQSAHQTSSAAAADQELTDMNNNNPLHLRNRFLDYHPTSLPSKLRVLNMRVPPNKVIMQQKVDIEEVSDMIDDLIRAFSMVLHIRTTSGSMENAQQNQTYIDAVVFSYQLSQVNFQDFVTNEDTTLFMKLSNALCMHGSIELHCEMRDVEAQYGNEVAYNIGGKVVTINLIMTFLAS